MKLKIVFLKDCLLFALASSMILYLLIIVNKTTSNHAIKTRIHVYLSQKKPQKYLVIWTYTYKSEKFDELKGNGVLHLNCGEFNCDVTRNRSYLLKSDVILIMGASVSGNNLKHIYRLLYGSQLTSLLSNVVRLYQIK